MTEIHLHALVHRGCSCRARMARIAELYNIRYVMFGIRCRSSLFAFVMLGAGIAQQIDPRVGFEPGFLVVGPTRNRRAFCLSTRALQWLGPGLLSPMFTNVQ